MTRILALDLATNIGFALGDLGGVKLSGSRKLPATGDDVGRFARAFSTWLQIGLKRHMPTVVVYEQPLLRSNGTSLATCRKLYGMAWEVERVCAENEFRIPVKEVNISDWRVHFLGRGNVPRKSDEAKKAVMRMCGIRGWAPQDFDQADALGILDFALACESPAQALKATPLFQDVAKPFVSAGDLAKAAKRKAAGLA